MKINLITLQGFGKSEARSSKLCTLCQAFQVSIVTGDKTYACFSVFQSVGWVSGRSFCRSFMPVLLVCSVLHVGLCIVKSAYEPSGPPGRPLSPVSVA